MMTSKWGIPGSAMAEDLSDQFRLGRLGSGTSRHPRDESGAMVGGGDDDHVAAVFDQLDMCVGIFFHQSTAMHSVIKQKIVGPEQDADRNGPTAVPRRHVLEIFNRRDQISRGGNVAPWSQRQEAAALDREIRQIGR